MAYTGEHLAAPLHPKLMQIDTRQFGSILAGSSDELLHFGAAH